MKKFPPTASLHENGRSREYPRPSSLSPLLDVAQVAAYFGRSTRWVYRNASALGGHKIGKPIVFSEADLVAYLAATRLDTPSQSTTAKGAR